MNWRAVLLSGALAAGLSVTLVPGASADPPRWAGRWNHHHEYRWNENPHWNRYYGNRGNWDRGYGDRWHSSDGRWYRNSWDRSSYYRRSDPNYGKLMGRMRYDRAKIAEIEPTGRHRKALQWYKDDLQNARRDLHNDYYAR